MWAPGHCLMIIDCTSQFTHAEHRQFINVKNLDVISAKIVTITIMMQVLCTQSLSYGRRIYYGRRSSEDYRTVHWLCSRTRCSSINLLGALLLRGCEKHRS